MVYIYLIPEEIVSDGAGLDPILCTVELCMLIADEVVLVEHDIVDVGEIEADTCTVD